MKSYFYLYFWLSLFIYQNSIAQENDQTNIDKRIIQLEERTKIAHSEYALWRDTIKHLNTAKDHADKGETQKALSLLDDVEFEINQSTTQAKEQADIDQLVPYYLKN